MTGPDPGARRTRPNGRLLLGLVLIGTGRPAGFAQFGASREAYLGSLAPWLGLLIVLAGVVAWGGHPGLGAAFFLVALCNLLAPAVIAELFCRLWQRREHWALYANVLNCSQWLMVAVFILLLPLASATVPFGASVGAATGLLLFVWFGYALWFHWFAARHALNVSRGRAVLVMMTVIFGTGLLLQVPSLIVGRSTIDELTSTLQLQANEGSK